MYHNFRLCNFFSHNYKFCKVSPLPIRCLLREEYNMSNKIDYKLQNILLKDDQKTHDYGSMYVRSAAPLIFNDDNTVCMPANLQYGFDTYFGALSAKKWNRYTSVENFSLHIKIKGSFIVKIITMSNDMEYDLAIRNTADTLSFNNTDMRVVNIPLPDNAKDFDLVAFQIITKTDCTFDSAWYTAQVDEESIRDIKLNIISPTFKKEEFVLANVKLFEELMTSDEAIAENLTVTIIDNGQTLEGPLSNLSRIKMYKNPNFGGAGGFTRGMIEAIHADEPPTHLLVMDDDVSVSLESFIRTYNLLAIVNDEYKDAFLSGAMLSMQLPDHQVEDVGCIFSNASFGSIKKTMRNLSDINHIVANEAVRFNISRQYAAFWYCCFPLDVVRKQGYTMPFFVRGDDAEFGLRDPNRKFMSMNGICVWHMSFGHSKFNAFNEAYLAIRNLLIIKAVVPSCNNVDVYGNLFRHDIETELRKFNYGYAEMMCDAVEDYLKGPEWLMNTNPEEILKIESAKKPKIDVFEEKLPPSVTRLYDAEPLGLKDKIIMKFTHNGHVHWNDSKMNNEPGIMLNEFRTYHANRLYMHKEMWFVNDDMTTGYKTHINREKYSEIVSRIEAIENKMATEGAVIAQRWREAYPTLTSEEFWMKFLSMGVEGDNGIQVGKCE